MFRWLKNLFRKKYVWNPLPRIPTSNELDDWDWKPEKIKKLTLHDMEDCMNKVKGISRYKYVINVMRKTKKSKWYVRTDNVNGNVFQVSETYSSKAKALQSAENNFNSYKRGHAKLVVQD